MAENKGNQMLFPVLDFEPDDVEVCNQFKGMTIEPDLSIELIETSTELRVEPGMISLCFVLLCALPVYAVFGWHFVTNVLPMGVRELDLIGLSIAIFSLLGTIVIVLAINKHLKNRGTFMIFEKNYLKLVLPRLGITLSQSNMVFFATIKASVPSVEAQVWTLIAVVKPDSRSWTCIPVVAVTSNISKAAMLARQLATYFDVPLRKLQNRSFWKSIKNREP